MDDKIPNIILPTLQILKLNFFKFRNEPKGKKQFRFHYLHFNSD